MKLRLLSLIIPTLLLGAPVGQPIPVKKQYEPLHYDPTDTVQVKNNTKEDLYVALGSKKSDPMNKKLILMAPGTSISENIPMQDYPEILLGSPGLPVDKIVYIYSLDPYAVQGQNVHNKTMWVEVSFAGLKSNDHFVVKPQTSGLFRRSITNNITAKEITSTKAYYQGKRPS